MHTNRPTFLFAALALALAVAGTAAAQTEQPPAGLKVVRLEARPASIDLKNPYEYRQLLLVAQTDSGDVIDVTRMARVEVPAALAKVSPAGQVRPVADGLGELTASVAGQTVRVPVTVSGQKVPYQVSFVRDVMPTISKVGCNAGTCHGSAEGKNGFKLSLRGYDPLWDHRSLTDDLEGRRFNRAAPERSLMLMKPSGAVPHVGGVLYQPGEPYYELVRAWIADGVKFDPNAPRVVAIEIGPQGPVVPKIGMRQQMAVSARYGDGSARDVTAEAFIESSNTEVATVDKQGLVTAVRRGEATVLARYEGAYAASTLVVMGDRSGFAWQDQPRYNWIDELVDEKLKQVKVQPSGLCTDTDFVRRVYLDLTGLPPQPEEVRAFLADARPSKVKRDDLVDKLVGGEAFVEHWTNKWADLLQVNRKFLGERGAAALRGWVRQAVASNMPYDEFVRTVLTASGSNLENPPAGYFKVVREPEAAMENTTQLFLAVRFNCNKCHDHPFERWTQDQYYQLASYFGQVSHKEDPRYKGQTLGGSAVEGAVPLVEVVSDGGGGDVKHIRTGQLAPPKFPYAHADQLPPTAPRRQQLAHWLASKDNPYFAKSYVNRLWAYLLGVGLIEPIDDIRAGNPPTNPKLLDRLSQEFMQSGFNVQHMMRLICKSRTYQLSIETNRWNADDEMNYSHALARRLPAEVIFDTVYRATGATPRLPGLPPGARAAQLLDSNVELPGGFLDLLGKPVRESACECERSSGLMLGPVLAMINGPIVADAIKDPGNRITRLVAAEKDDGKLVEELFLAILCRPPTESEKRLGVETLRQTKADYDRLIAEHARKVAALATYEKQIDAKQVEWEKSVQKGPNWVPLDVAKAVSKGGATLTKQPDGSLLATGPNGFPEVYTVTAETKLTGITGVRLEVLPDPSLPAQGPGRAPNGNYVLNEFKLTQLPAGDTGKPKGVKLQNAVADFSQDGWAVAGAIDNNPASGWAVMPAFGKPHAAVFEVAGGKLGSAAGSTLTFTLDQQYPGKDHTIGRFRLAVTTDRQPSLTGSLPDAIAKVLNTPAEKRSPDQKAALANYFRSVDGELARLRAEAAQQPPADQRVLGAQDLAWALINTPGFLFNH
jgi:hypothetical protein